MEEQEAEERMRLRALETRLRSILETLVPQDLSILRQFGRNIGELKLSKNWDEVTKEQRKANRTLKQLRTHLRQLGEMREEIDSCDLRQFDRQVGQVQTQILQAISSFRKLDSQEDIAIGEQDEWVGQDFLVLEPELVSQEWEELQEQLEELHSLASSLTQHIQAQSQGVVTLEEKVVHGAQTVQETQSTMNRIMQVKAMALPMGWALAGGLVGGVIAGPLGALVGANVAAVSALAGGAAGAVGGGYLGYKKNKSATVKLS